MADPIFEYPRLAAIYDALDPDRSDLDAYVAIADELGARRVLEGHDRQRPESRRSHEQTSSHVFSPSPALGTLNATVSFISTSTEQATSLRVSGVAAGPGARPRALHALFRSHRVL